MSTAANTNLRDLSDTDRETMLRILGDDELRTIESSYLRVLEALVANLATSSRHAQSEALREGFRINEILNEIARETKRRSA